MAVVRNISTTPLSAPATTPQDSQALFKRLLSDSILQTADMRVEGNWTYRQLANHITARTFVDGYAADWDAFREVNWSAQPNLVEADALINIGTPASRDSSFGSGDPGIGVNAGNGYRGYGQAGDTSALVVGGQTVVTADEGTRAVAWNAPRDADLVQLISQQEWGHQASVVAAVLTDLPGIGNSSQWRVPTYWTVDGDRSFLAAYSYSYSGAVFGVPVFQTSFDITPANDTSFTFALVDSTGETVTTTDVDIPSGGQTVNVTWGNAPGSGNVAIDSHGTGYTISNTDVSPPTL